MSDTQCSQEVFGERVTHWRCLRAGRVERKGKWYCTQHDPERIKARVIKESSERQEAQRRGRRIDQEGQRIAKVLGVAATTFFSYRAAPCDSTDGVRESLVITFDQLRRLTERVETLRALVSNGIDGWSREDLALAEQVVGQRPADEKKCCERDDDGDGNCPIHSAQGVLR